MSLGAGNWNRLEDLFHEAVDLPPAERPAFLDRVCDGDEELRRDLESLLAADLPTDPRFRAAVARAAEELPTSGDATDELIGERVGRYSITRLIGKGGMGAVYHAVREDDFRMQVAIKLLKRGTDTEAALGRFRTERQILAGLQHPNIARLLDGGATGTGLPYFVMEYVEGTPLLEFAAPTSVSERLELFRSVCSAVQYAHERNIVHRDIKPANILVTPEGIPKLLDFGIAKLIEDPADGSVWALTATGVRLMTPSYASPEQVRGESVKPATDIYSLGAVLYELLTGARAQQIESSSASEIENEICAKDPKKPSTVCRHLDPDLDNIVMMALRKEPERRYATVREFADDIDRFLKNLPVHARKNSPLYRSRKFLKRHRVPILAASIAIILVLALIAALPRITLSSARIDSARKQTPAAASLWDRLTFVKIAALGDPAPGGGLFTNSFEPYGLDSHGDLAFTVDLSTGGEGVFLLKHGPGLPMLALARAAQPAPGGGTLDGVTLGFTAINDSGDVAFAFGLKPMNAPELKGFYKAGLYRYSSADQKLTAIVVPGLTIAPGFGPFQSIGTHASLNKSGQIVFAGLVRTMAGLRPANGFGQGIFSADRNGSITKVVAPGDPAPGGGKFDFAQNPWINDKKDVAFGAHVADEECVVMMSSGACLESVYVKDGANGSIQSIAHQGDQEPSGRFYRGAWGPVVNNRGDVVFMGELMPLPGVTSARGVYLHSRGVTVAIATPGDVMPDHRKLVTVNPGRGVGNYSLNNRGDVSFNARLENNESGLYVYSQGLLHLVAGTGTELPSIGTIANVASLINGGTLNDAGQIFFWATMTDGKGVLLLATPSGVK